MTLMKTIPNVRHCTVHECAYNDHEDCHAAAITVDGPEPMCDTFFKSSQKGGIPEQGAVGACKNSVCVYNDSYECTASGIQVSLHSDYPACDTFTVRPEPR